MNNIVLPTNGDLMLKFTDLQIHPEIQRALDGLGFTTPTQIQAQAIPLLKSSQIDFHGQAQTGTGKTIAFGIPLIEQTEGKGCFPEALIIAPTRELVVQIVDSLQALAKYRKISIEPIYGGVSMFAQEKALRKGVHIVVGTPGRLLDHLNRGLLKLHKIKTLVLDEADVMLDMGFKADIDAILKCTPDNRNIWLFSATVKPGIDDIKISHMKNPVIVRVASQQVTTNNTKQYYAVVGQKDRLAALSRFIDCTPNFYGIVFSPTKLLADQLSKDLAKAGYEVEALHGDMGQAARNNVIKRFKDKKVNLLIATDVAARGIDVAGLTHVINYALPREQENYVHRIGRTGRAGNEGVAITFIANNELNKLKRLAKKFKADIVPLKMPTVHDLIDVKIEKTIEQIKNICTSDVVASSAAVNRLRPLLDTYSKDQLISGLLNMLLSSLVPAKAEEVQDNNDHYKRRDDGSCQELMLNVGTMDGVSTKDVLTFILDSKKIERNQIRRLRVIRKLTYVTVDADLAEDLMMELHNKKLAGRKIRVSLVNS